jgi:hypothetical protein
MSHKTQITLHFTISTAHNVTQNTNCSTLYHKHFSQSTLHSPTVSSMQIKREPSNSEYLLNVNNSQQQDINITQLLLEHKLQYSEKLSRNTYHESNTSNSTLQSHIIKIHFCIIFKSVWCSTVTGIYTGGSEVQTLAAATELSLLQNIQTQSSTHPPSN